MKQRLLGQLGRRGFFGLTFFVAAGGLAASAHAQIMVMEAAVAAPENQSNLPGFQIPIDDSLATSFSDFERHAGRGDWEKAFRALNEIPVAKRKGMLRAEKGMIVPAAHRIWEAIAELPADGREAFRVFFDAKARNLWKSLEQTKSKPQEATKIARRVFDEYFLTSVGDDAANYLGDAAFEQGDFSEANRYWKANLDHHPNTDLGERRIQVKQALALVQMGRLASFDALRKSLQQQSGQTVQLGGESVDPIPMLRRLREEPPVVAGSSSVSDPEQQPLPEGPFADDTQTAWRLQFLSDQGKQQLDNAVNSNYWYRNGMETWIPPYATAKGRVFCNWFGIVFGLDATTGKLLWRSDKFDKIHGKFSQLPHASANLEQFAVVAGKDTVLALWINPERLNYHREPFRLIAYDAETGKERWNTEKLQPLKEYSFVGEPLILGDEVLATCHKRNESKLQLRSLKLADGTENWTAELGTAQQSQNRRGNQVMPLPQLHRDGQVLHILTNNGALLAFNLAKQQLDWVLKYGTVASGNSNGVFYSGEIDTATLLHSYGVLLEQDGILYAKESDGRVIHTIDPSGPKLLWSRPIAPECVLVGVDADHLYVLGRELMAIDRQTQKLVWARRLPIEGGGLSAVVGPDSVYVSSTRGIYCINRVDGRLQNIFRGEDLGAVGAWIDTVGDRLISVSNTAITAYPLNDSTTDDSQVNTTSSGS